MPKIKKVLSDYEEVLWYDSKHASWFETAYWHALKRKIDSGKNAEASALIIRNLPMIPLAKYPMKEVLNHYDYRAQIILNHFKHIILPGTPDDYLNKIIEETAFISGENKEAIRMLSDSGIEVHIGSAGTPKEVIEEHLRIHGMKDYISSVVANPMKVDYGIDFKVRYADREGKYRIMKEIRGKTPYNNFAIIDDEPDVAGLALEEAYYNGGLYNGGLVRIMKSRKKYKHPYQEVGNFKEFADLAIS